MSEFEQLILSPRACLRSARNLFALSTLLILPADFASAEDLLAQSVNHPSYSVDEFSKVLLIPSAAAGGKPLPLTERRDVVHTGLGNVSVRWPTALHAQLSFTPASVIQTSWRAAEQVLVERGFSADLLGDSYDWNVVVSGDGAALVPGVSRVSSSYCHTALMGPPADIVIDGFRLLHPCSSGMSPEQALIVSLAHEVGHAVEYRLLDKGFSRRQRWHGEGFATWFETEARSRLPFRSGLQDDIRRLRERARSALASSWRPYLFRGSPEDYARSYGLVATIAETHSVDALIRVYRRMATDNCLFEDAVQRELGLSFEQWLTEARSYLGNTPGPGSN